MTELRTGPRNRQVARKRSAPSARDLEIHRRYTVNEEDRHELAVEFGVTPPRISQIKRAVEEWHVSHYRELDHQRRVLLWLELNHATTAAMERFHRDGNPELLTKVVDLMREQTAIWRID